MVGVTEKIVIIVCIYNIHALQWYFILLLWQFDLNTLFCMETRITDGLKMLG